MFDFKSGGDLHRRNKMEKLMERESVNDRIASEKVLTIQEALVALTKAGLIEWNELNDKMHGTLALKLDGSNLWVNDREIGTFADLGLSVSEYLIEQSPLKQYADPVSIPASVPETFENPAFHPAPEPVETTGIGTAAGKE